MPKTLQILIFDIYYSIVDVYLTFYVFRDTKAENTYICLRGSVGRAADS